MDATTVATARVHPGNPSLKTLEKLHRLRQVRAQLRVLTRERDQLLAELSGLGPHWVTPAE